MNFWFTKNTNQILIEHYNLTPDKELTKIMDNLVENYLTDAWYYIAGFNEQQIKFIVNNFPYNKFKKHEMTEFFVLTADHSNKKLIAEEWCKTGNLQKAIETFKTDKFDPKILDFLEGKITDEKLINWAVGQVMKNYPKKYSPGEIKQAITERWF